MKISKLALIALLGSALMAFGCSDDEGTNGGTGGGGTGGGGTGGGGTGGVIACMEEAARCAPSVVEAVVPCCELPAPPDDADACVGDESLENPAECELTGTVVTHRLTLLAIAEDCAAGENIDQCAGNSCKAGGLSPGDGEGGVDNAVYGLNKTLVDGNLGNVGGVNQAFSDSFCGLTDGDEDETECNDPVAIDELVIELAVDANTEAGCANVTLTSGGASADVKLNLGAVTEAGTVCASGTLGEIPIAIAGETGAMTNATVRMTVSQERGFSNGVLSATIDGETAVTIAELLATGAGAVVGSVFDIRLDLAGDTSQSCDALSATFVIGGVPVTN